MERKFTTEEFDKFSNSKTISTNRQKKFGGWTETFEANQSLMIYKNDMAMPSVSIDFEVRLFGSIVHLSGSSNEKVFIEILNYFKDGYADKTSNAQDFSNCSLDLVIDNETLSIKAQVLKNDENRFARSGLNNKDIFNRKQLLKFSLTIEQFDNFCGARNLAIRISGVQNPVRLSNNDKGIHEFDSNAVNSLQAIGKQLYNEAVQSGKYSVADTPSSTSASGKGGCFIATAATGNYNHPIVLDLRMFRDNWLLKRNWGVAFTNWYYKYGSMAAKVIDKSPLLKKLTLLTIVKPLHFLTKKFR
jgi:hypothetical protein